MDHRLPDIEPQEVLAAAKSIKLDTGLGVDFVDPYMLKNMTVAAARHLADLLMKIEREVHWPDHIYANLIVLMGKPAGGCRPIALMPMLYRI